jgi:hypothetical protein
MTTGRRYKFNGSQIQVLTGFGAPATGIKAISKANPAVVTDETHGRADGDTVFIDDALGMTEINGGTYIINVLTADTYELVGVDSTAYGTYTSGAMVSVGEFSNFCELTGYNRAGGTSPEIDATTICSEAAEYEVGLPDFGTTTIDYNFAPQTAIQQAIASFYNGANAGQKFAVKVILPNSGGSMVQLGTISQTSESASNNGLWTASLTIRNTGARQDFAAA